MSTRAKMAELRSNLRLVRERTAALGRPARIGYIGGEGHGNLGDDAMFRAARKLLGDTAVISLDHPKRERRLARLRLAGPRYFRSAALGGGTLINPIWIDRVRSALDQGLAVWSLGTGVGSCGFFQPEGGELAPWIPLLRHFARIGVRGPRSRSQLSRMGVEKAEIVGDLALALAREGAAAPSLAPPRFAVNVSAPWAEHADPASRASLRGLRRILTALTRQGWQAVPVAMHPADLPVLNWLLHGLAPVETPIAVLASCEDFFSRVEGCSFAVTVRLHAAVLSCCVGVPPLMLGYRDKCLDFMESMKLEEWHLDYDKAEPDAVSDTVRRLIDAAADLRATVLARALQWRRRLEAYVDSIRAS